MSRQGCNKSILHLRCIPGSHTCIHPPDFAVTFYVPSTRFLDPATRAPKPRISVDVANILRRRMVVEVLKRRGRTDSGRGAQPFQRLLWPLSTASQRKDSGTRGRGKAVESCISEIGHFPLGSTYFLLLNSLQSFHLLDSIRDFTSAKKRNLSMHYAARS